MHQRRLTRAALAEETGISKPSVGESVRRLALAGLVADTGERTPGGRGRGRVGTYYALAAEAGAVLAINVDPEGITAECVDAYGDTLMRAQAALGRPAGPQQVTAAFRMTTERAAGGGPAIRAAVVSAAGPVDRATGRLVRLPDEPFRLGEFDPAAILRPLVSGPVIVDNDVNWAARAERDAAGRGPDGDFAYLFLGEGLGAAVISSGEVVRGHAGLAGEVAHIIVPGPGAARFIDVFGVLGLQQPGSTAIDVPRVLAVTAGPGSGAAVRESIAEAVSGVLAALTALADPEFVVVGGPWGSQPAILDAITARAARLPRPVAIRPAAVTSEPSLAGARAYALSLLRSAILRDARERTGTMAAAARDAR
ncbi:ROK family transcriptional regulator [Trebonia kvetii]|uniref:ROK family transcriptional regulator n=2 Tax=Trebonia kvetii TaxID=2480626 RepID=A0A6P2C2M6_9ACTN|nr:ROK family transcriptional regulator [Trebonia kvetii]